MPDGVETAINEASGTYTTTSRVTSPDCLENEGGAAIAVDAHPRQNIGHLWLTKSCLI